MGPSVLLRARGLDSPFPWQLPRATACQWCGRFEEVAVMDVEQDDQEIIARVAALDIGKAEVVCCVRVPGPGRRRLQEVRTF